VVTQDNKHRNIAISNGFIHQRSFSFLKKKSKAANEWRLFKLLLYWRMANRNVHGGSESGRLVPRGKRSPV